MGELGEVCRTESLFEFRKVVASERVGAEGIVDGEHEAIDADDVQGAAERGLGEVAAGGEMDVGLEVGSNRLAQFGGVGEGFRGAGEGPWGASRPCGR